MDTALIESFGAPIWAWGGFIALVLALMVFDLGVLHRKAHEIGIRESLYLSIFYLGLGVAFGGLLWIALDPQAGMLYLTGFVVEKSLAMDNIFVIAMIFSYFGIPRLYQHRVLVFGVIGVLLLRGLLIGVGAAAVAEFRWILYLFAAFLVFTGIKMLFAGDDDAYDVENNPVLKYMRRHMRLTEQLHGDRFFVSQPAEDGSGKLVRYATPLLLALVMVEIADVIFAVDSIPAIFAITTDPFVVFTSNIFAILGLRALFFLLVAVLHRFVFMKYALSLVLVFIGGKILVSELMALEHMSPLLSLGITLAILLGGILASLWRTRNSAVTAEVPVAEAE